MQKQLIFFSKNISIYAIFNDQNFNDTLTNDIVSFEQLSPGPIDSIQTVGRIDVKQMPWLENMEVHSCQSMCCLN